MKNLNVTQLKEQIKNSKKLNIALLSTYSTTTKERDYRIDIFYYKFPKEKPFVCLVLVTEDYTTTKQYYTLTQLKDCVNEVNRFNLTGKIYS
jgi:hypothetical protein